MITAKVIRFYGNVSFEEKMTKRLTMKDEDYYLIIGLKSKHKTESLVKIMQLEGLKLDTPVHDNISPGQENSENKTSDPGPEQEKVVERARKAISKEKYQNIIGGLVDWMKANKIHVNKTEDDELGRYWSLKECPFDPTHNAPDVRIWCVSGTGEVKFHCKHCPEQHTWKEVKDHVEMKNTVDNWVG